MSHTADQDGLPEPRRTWAVVTIALGLMMSVMDGSIANLALPTLAHEFGVSEASSIWIVNAYQLAVTISLLPLAALGEIVGYRTVSRAGILTFTIASVACTFSDSLPTLVAARILQGFGAAGIMSVNSALVRFIYPRNLLGRGFGINVMVGSVSSAVGPSIAAAILSVAGWQWLFAVNIPIGVLVLVLGTRTLPITPRGTHKFDWGSAVLNAAAFGLFISGIEAIGHGGDRSIAAIEITAAAITGYFLARRQVSRTNPLLPVDLLRRPIFALSVTAATCSFAAQSMAIVTLPFYFELHLGLTRGETGLLMTPWPVTVALVAPLAGRLSDRFSPAIMGAIGQACMASGLVALALLPDAPIHGQHNVAPVPLRHRLRPVQLPEQPHHHRVCPCQPQRRRQRHAGHQPPPWPNPRHRHRRHDLRCAHHRRRSRRPRRGRSLFRVRSRGERLPPEATAMTADRDVPGQPRSL